MVRYIEKIVFLIGILSLDTIAFVLWVVGFPVGGLLSEDESKASNVYIKGFCLYFIIVLILMFVTAVCIIIGAFLPFKRFKHYSLLLSIVLSIIYLFVLSTLLNHFIFWLQTTECPAPGPNNTASPSPQSTVVPPTSIRECNGSKIVFASIIIAMLAKSIQITLSVDLLHSVQPNNNNNNIFKNYPLRKTGLLNNLK